MIIKRTIGNKNLWGREKTLFLTSRMASLGPNPPHQEKSPFSLFQFQNSLATLFSPPFKTEWPPRHSFYPFSKPIGVCETLFTAFQFQNVLATLFSPPFKTIWPLRHSFRPFLKPIGRPCEVDGVNLNWDVHNDCIILMNNYSFLFR